MRQAYGSCAAPSAEDSTAAHNDAVNPAEKMFIFDQFSFLVPIRLSESGRTEISTEDKPRGSLLLDLNVFASHAREVFGRLSVTPRQGRSPDSSWLSE